MKLDDYYHGMFRYSYLLMRLGGRDFSRGLKLYESRLKFAHSTSYAPKYYQAAYNEWQNNPQFYKGKTIFVYCEQGYGDTLMFSRLLYPLCKKAKKVYLAPQNGMYELFEARLDKAKFPNLSICNSRPSDCDYLIPLTSLALFLGLDSIEAIKALPTPLKLKQKKAKNRVKKVGFFWHTKMAESEPNTRNFDPNFFLEILKGIPNIELVSLQVGDYSIPQYIENRGPQLKNWLDTFYALADIDLLIGIDSALIHLGALCELPTAVILQPRFDWRYGKYESPKALFYKDNVRCFVTNPNDISIKPLIQNYIIKTLNL